MAGNPTLIVYFNRNICCHISKLHINTAAFMQYLQKILNQKFVITNLTNISNILAFVSQ